MPEPDVQQLSTPERFDVSHIRSVYLEVGDAVTRGDHATFVATVHFVDGRESVELISDRKDALLERLLISMRDAIECSE